MQAELAKAPRDVLAVPPTGPYKTVSVPPNDIALLITALEHFFDHVVKTEKKSQKLEHIRDVHDFFRRTLTT